MMENSLREFSSKNNTELFIVTCTSGTLDSVNGLTIPQYYYKLACQYNNASDTLFLKVSNTKVETNEEKEEREKEAYELRDARKGLREIGEEFDPFAEFRSHHTFGFLPENCY